jgi:hypothetical protein
MPIPADRRRSHLARQIGTLALAHVRIDNPMAPVRAATWHNVLTRLGVNLPLFVVHDLGLMLTAPRGAGGWALGARKDLLYRIGVPQAVQPFLARYEALLADIARSEVIEKASGWRLRDELVALLISRVYGDVYNLWPNPAKAAGAGELPLEPGLYTDADPAAHFADFDPGPLWGFLQHLAQQTWHVYASVEQIDLDTLRLLGMFRERSETQGPIGGAVDLAELLAALKSSEANDVVNFSLELLPSVLETKRAAGAQTFAVDGYASIERRGSLDSLVLSEFAYDDDLFDRKVVDHELYYYAHERHREEERRLQYVLVDASASMRGQRQVFARGLALTLIKKLSLQGDEIWLRFFDSRLYDVVKVARTGAFSVPYLLTFRSERGRNYGKVFRQLLLELGRLKREARRRVVVYLVTHGQCHVPVELVAQMKPLAYLYGIIILPSQEVTLDYLQYFDKVQIVSAEALSSKEGRKDRALDIVSSATEQAQPAPATPKAAAPLPRRGAR